VKEPSMILTFLKNLIRKISTVLKKSLSREVLIFLIFLFISCVFWVLQSLQEISEVELKIPVSYSEIPSHISITNKLPKTLRITLRDKGTNLYYYYRHRRELTVKVDLLHWYRKDGIGKIPMTVFDSFLRNRLMSTTQLLRVNPDTISVFFVEKASKVVPVHLNSSLSLSAQHMLSNAPELSPAFITVFAPASVLSKLNQIETEVLKLKDLGDSTTVSLNLIPVNGVHYSQKTIDVHLNVEEFTEKNLVIPVTGWHFPAGEELLSFPSSVKVSFFVGLSNYAKMTPDSFQISVDHANLLNSDRSAQKLLLIYSPKNIRNLRIQPETVDCLIEKK
jgi:YbbR-like protein